jgi:hypothetical protein
MSSVLSWLAISIFIALAVWCLGGITLRVGGCLMFIGALFATAETGWLPAALLATVGGLAWLGGHWLYGVRHHYIDSPLAQRLFLQVLPRRLDPTRRWNTIRADVVRARGTPVHENRAPRTARTMRAHGWVLDFLRRHGLLKAGAS